MSDPSLGITDAKTWWDVMHLALEICGAFSGWCVAAFSIWFNAKLVRENRRHEFQRALQERRWDLMVSAQESVSGVTEMLSSHWTVARRIVDKKESAVQIDVSEMDDLRQRSLALDKAVAGLNKPYPKLRLLKEPEVLEALSLLAKTAGEFYLLTLDVLDSKCSGQTMDSMKITTYKAVANFDGALATAFDRLPQSLLP